MRGRAFAVLAENVVSQQLQQARQVVARSAAANQQRHINRRGERHLLALLERNELLVLGPNVICGGPDDLVVDSLFDHMRAPAAGA